MNAFYAHLESCDTCNEQERAVCPIGSEFLVDAIDDMPEREYRAWEPTVRAIYRNQDLEKEAALNGAFYSGGEL